MMEITTMWFLTILLGQTGFGSLYWFDTLEECERAKEAVLGRVDGAHCAPQPFRRKE